MQLLRLLQVLVPAVVCGQVPTITAVVNGGSHYGALSPGALAVIQGTNFAGLSIVTVGGRQAAVVSTATPPIGAATVQLPFELTPGPTTVTVTTPAGVSQPLPITLDSYAPVITGFSRPTCLFAAPGDLVEAYAVGLGPTEPFMPSGILPQVATPTAVRPILIVGGKPAEVLASVLVTWKLGVYQINFRVPFGLPEGIHPVMITVDGKSSDQRANGMLAVSEEAADRWTFMTAYPVAPAAITVAQSCGRGGFGELTVSADPKNPPDSLGGLSVKVKDSVAVERAAPVLFVGTGQVGYIIPSGTTTGMARITITSANGTVSTATLAIENVAPRIFFDSSWTAQEEFPASVVVRVRDRQQTVSRLVFPIDLGEETEEIYLSVFGTGFQFRSALENVKATIGGVDAPVLYAGPQGEFVGMDQINLRLPRSLAGRGLVQLQFTIDSKVIHGGYLQFK